MNKIGLPNKSVVLVILACLIAGIAGAIAYEIFVSTDKENIAKNAHLAVPLTEISSYTLLERMNAGDESFIIVDSRDKTAYDLGHIKGAISLTVSEVNSRYQELPADKDIIVYCWSAECMLGPSTAAKLTELGVKNILELRIGWCEWSERGFPIKGKRYILEGECFIEQRSVNKEKIEVIRKIDETGIQCSENGGC